MRYHLITLLCVLLAACAPSRTPLVITAPVPNATIQITDSKPLVAAVERQSARLEGRVADTAKKVDAINASVGKTVDAAVRAGDAAREAQARELQAQVSELKSMTDIAQATAQDLREDSQATHTELAKIAVERDEAFKARETIRQQMIELKEQAKVTLSRMDERRITEYERAEWWKKRALYTWGALAAIGGCLVALKIFKLI